MITNSFGQAIPEILITDRLRITDSDSMLTRSNYFKATRGMRSLAPEWQPEPIEVRSNILLLNCVDYGQLLLIDPQLEEKLAAAWHRTKYPVGSVEREVIKAVSSALGYTFVNEHLAMQALTRRSYTVEHPTERDYEVLEFIGDSVVNMCLVKLMAEHYTIQGKEGLASGADEAAMSLIRSRFTGKEYLAARCEALNLERFIRRGASDTNDGDDPKEDIVEALVGAVALDCEWDMEVLTHLVDLILDPQFPVDPERTDYCDTLEQWCERHEGVRAEYRCWENTIRVSEDGKPLYDSDLKLTHPAFEKCLGGGDGYKFFHQSAVTRSMAKSASAREAIHYLKENGLWVDIRDAKVKVSLDTAINQLQELYQKKYVSERPVYTFRDDGETWWCECTIGGEYQHEGRGKSKGEAKKEAALNTLKEIVEASRSKSV